MTKPDDNDHKDGFDLLEYPCEFQFKAMVKVAGLEEGQSAVSAMEILIKSQNLGELLSITSAVSRTGRYESVSLTLYLEARDQLEAIYAALANDPNVVMTL